MNTAHSKVEKSCFPLCLLVPAGPGPEEVARIADLMEAAAHYSNLPLCAVIINDANDGEALRLAGTNQGIPTYVLPNARNGRGEWWTGGLCTAMLAALQWIGRNLCCCGVLRLDSDALIINPFASQVRALLSANPKRGIVGNFDSATGAPVGLGHLMTTRLYWRSKLVSLDRENGKLITTFWGWRRRMRHLIHSAQAQGYPLGSWVQGGAYALSPQFISRMVHDRRFDEPDDFIHNDLCEDVLMILIVYSLGLEAHYTVGPSRLFASKWKGLYDAPEALAKAGHGVVHSVKHFEARDEANIRSTFKQLRSLHRFERADSESTRDSRSVNQPNANDHA
jgi:hypothetical protein